MRKRTSILLIITILASSSLSIISISNNTAMLSKNDDIATMGTITGNLEFPFQKTLTLDGNNFWNMTDLLDVNQTLENIATFEGDGITAYTGSDIVPEIDDTRYLVEVNILDSYINDDKDALLLGAGEIYFNITVNGNFTETIRYSANDGDTIVLNLEVFHFWCYTIDVVIEVWEDDIWPTPDDSLGTLQFYDATPNDVLIGGGMTDTGDAEITFTIDVLDSETSVTAEELADGCKPYLYFCDETGATEEADGVFSRVLKGIDAEIHDQETLCIQYIFYWVEEYFPSPVNVKFHTYDFEEFLIFLDPDDYTQPYRYVFDDGSYVSNTQSSRIAIWGYESSYIQETDAYIIEDLTPLLGNEYQTDFKYFDINDATNEMRSGLNGIRTMNILVQTSFHNFQEGPPGALDIVSTELGYDYSISELNDSKIREFFRIHYEAFEEGLWWISYIGKDTPKVHPFTFDIMNPFVFPYVLNGYTNVVEDIDAFQKANKNFVDYEYEIEITPSFTISAEYTITAPDTATQGEEIEATIAMEIDEDDTELAINYDLFLNGTVKSVFLNKNFIFDNDGKYAVNIPLGTLGFLMESLGHRPFQAIGMYGTPSEYEHLTIDNFALSPHLLGNIMEANATLHIWDMIKDELGTMAPAANKSLELIDFFVDSIDFTMGTVFEGFVNGTITTSSNEIGTVADPDYEFDGTTMTKTVTITVADDALTGDIFDISVDESLFNFAFQTDWKLEVEFGDIIGLIAPQYQEMEFTIGTFPDISWHSDDSDQGSTGSVAKVVTITSSGGGGIEFLFLSASLVVGIAILVFRRKNRK